MTQSLQAPYSKLPVRIVVPRTPKDFQQISSLLVKVFDEPGGETWIEKAGWWLVEQFVTEGEIRDQYWNTAKQMKGNKYTVLLAKVNSKVVGMAELGVSQHIGIQQQEHSQNDFSQDDGITTSATTINTLDGSNGVLVGATIGVLAILPEFQNQGIGNILLQKCEALAVSDAWNQDVLFAEVEPQNLNALDFFQRKGYTQEGRMVPVTVRRKRVYEERPHLLLYKNLPELTYISFSLFLEHEISLPI
eukprot:CAMPEP_0195289856 /NCGR_PEP_ID=MMETSP0707-20130614/5961_1 /TAXON_ID=33640 /ORGANISM="Asterionellopsis glacialis, Strain CCMP134" /LENGTH=246 /DNA_ID=CAMNT_0040349907 /DNA_START=32 /DNA_END=773 /DNA_ORIENTATION=-